VVARTVTNTFAVVTLVPLIVHCADRLRSGQRPISVKRAAEAITLALTILAVCVLLFFLPTDSPERTPLLLYAPLPLLGWATVRFGVSGACAASLAAGAISMLAMVNGFGPLNGADPVENALSAGRLSRRHGHHFPVVGGATGRMAFRRPRTHASRARFRSIFENNIIPTAIWRDDLRISEANDAFLRLTGFSGAISRTANCGSKTWRRSADPWRARRRSTPTAATCSSASTMRNSSWRFATAAGCRSSSDTRAFLRTTAA
jgi:PAS domain-containing protein